MTDPVLVVREALPSDLSGIVALYNHYIAATPITFDIEPYSVETRTPWFEQFRASGPHRLFVAVTGSAPAHSAVLGYACSTRWHAKAAYDSSVECSVYVARDAVRRGIGRALYERLFAALADEPVHRAYAGITQPNTASVTLHERFGFQLAATYHEVGFKLGRYWDVHWYEKRLG